jgi:hypothetical protein
MTAREMAKRRWRNVSAEDRSAHGKKTVEARKTKAANSHASEVANAKARISEAIKSLLFYAAHENTSRAYYELGYRLGVAQLDEASRNRAIQSLEKKEHNQLYEYGRRLSDWERGTLDALRQAQVERLAMGRDKLAGWNNRRPSASLREIFKDSAIIALIPRSRHYVFLSGFRAGALGEGMRYHRPRKIV